MKKGKEPTDEQIRAKIREFIDRQLFSKHILSTHDSLIDCPKCGNPRAIEGRRCLYQSCRFVIPDHIFVPSDRWLRDYEQQVLVEQSLKKTYPKLKEKIIIFHDLKNFRQKSPPRK